jgi:hypothetical protein
MQNEASEVLGMEDLNSPVIGGQNVENPAGSPAMSGPEKPKDKPKSKEDENELYDQMFFSPSSSNADTTVTLTNTTDESEDEREARERMKNKDSKDLLKILEKGESKTSEKYQKQLLDKALKDPSSVQVKTEERGWMTVRDAIDQGFNMVTGKFDREPIPPVDWEGELSKLDPREQETIRRLTRPGTGQAGPRPVMQPQSGEASLEEAGVNPRPDVPPVEPPASDAGMAMGSAPEIPLGM